MRWGAAKLRLKRSNEAMDLCAGGGPKTTITKPGDLIDEPSLPGFALRAGPPRDQDAMKESAPTAARSDGVSAGLRSAAYFMRHPGAKSSARKKRSTSLISP